MGFLSLFDLITDEFPYEFQVLPHEISVANKEHYMQLRVGESEEEDSMDVSR